MNVNEMMNYIYNNKEVIEKVRNLAMNMEKK